ncbi:orotidine-5'-phosphate decarboxylase [Halorhodospira abdelmalekii]|uniref:orotidine-5'-phosphate decarboxylase n=1 Tax=Halorhodospira abdelmalekii TaxID=421629 RepID=UPI001907C522|nr:orotidine-5'-phosphate decarboxylase [Halorhodospira abdelmalekii]MBK1734510.1 orotidine-5'-phosphate decarboxylase [Halorhodospira abdelmalekii]
MGAGPRLIVALDYPNAAAAEAMAARLDPQRCRLKVGKELFTRAGPAIIERLQRRGFEIFLDLKYHDIPHTVAAACQAAAELGVWMVNVHALGGGAMLAAARAALDRAYCPPPWLIAVTVLTSHDRETLRAIGLTGPPDAAVQRLSALAQAEGLDGVVCSVREAAALRAQCGSAWLLVTPGVRPEAVGQPGVEAKADAWAGADDQRRTATPAAARAAGVDFIVVGRPITQADAPLAALSAIEAQWLGLDPAPEGAHNAPTS